MIFIKFCKENILHPELLKFIVLDIHNSLSPKDKNYFSESRGIIHLDGRILEEFVLDREKRLPHFQKLLSSIRKPLNEQNFVAVETPGFSDYIIFGAFQWARCISNFSLINPNDPIFNWREKNV